MRRVNVLSDGFSSPNARALAFPLIVHNKRLKERGIDVRLFDRADAGIDDCDVLIVDGKFFRYMWGERTAEVFALLERFSTNAGATIYFDTTDSAGWIKAEALPHVTRYYKNQLLKDRGAYMKPLYGLRYFTDYYHREFGVVDAKPALQDPVTDPALLDKLRLGWHSGLADYSLHGPFLMELYHRTHLPLLLGYPSRFHAPSVARPLDVSCRMGISYDRETVCFQRKKIRELLVNHLKSDKLSRRAFFKEMIDSKVVISPFGLGEITLKDFEVFVCGGLLVKPDMSHMETWPDFFQSGKTMVSFDWDLKTFKDQIDDLVTNFGDYIDIARDGQELYRKYVSTPEGYDLFCDRFGALVEDALR